MSKFKIGDWIELDKDVEMNRDHNDKLLKEYPYHYKITDVFIDSSGSEKILFEGLDRMISDGLFVTRFKLSKKHYFNQELEKILNEKT